MRTMTGVGAAAALLTGMTAVADVNIQGELKIGMASLDMEGKTGRKLVLDTANSYLSFNGDEALPSGMKAFFDISTRMCLDGSQTVANDCRVYDRTTHAWREHNGFASRAGWVGLRGQFGDIRLGRGKTPFDEVVDRYDPSTGIGTGMTAWVERVFPGVVPFDAASAAPIIAGFGQQIYAATFAQATAAGAPNAAAVALATQASTTATQTLTGAVQQRIVPALVAQFPTFPTIGRYTEPEGTFNNAIRYDYGKVDGPHFVAMYAVGENKTATTPETRRLSLNAGYSTGPSARGQFRIDAVFDQQKNVLTHPVADQVLAGLVAAQTAATPLLAGALLQAGIPAALANAVAGNVMGAVITSAASSYSVKSENTSQHFMVASSYVFPIGRVGLAVDRIALSQTGLAEIRRTNWSLNWELGWKNLGGYMGYRRLGASNMGGVHLHDHERKIGAGIERYFSKRTKLIAEYNNNKIEGGKVVHTILGGIVHKF
ncbi:porin [Chitinimonas sp. BJB300]|uniref:porin n=1 Tax=Chitinimonas sp. BJB300 TaxID=1559339 RepID=UPI001304570B|nr:porin [Chitinimonas sp. BJB300]